jgi:shikimate dehydrogenase
MRIYGIFGDPIGHTLSPTMHNAALAAMGIEASYHAFRVPRDRLRDALFGAEAMGFGGVNLTIPLKEIALQIIPADELAEKIGAVNTVSFKEGLRGHNTDGRGALQSLQDTGVLVRGSNVVLIGAGGAARAIAYTLAREGAEIAIANRNVLRAKELAESIGSSAFGLQDLEGLIPRADVVINATSVGLQDGDHRLFPGRLLKRGQVVFDVIYSRETELLKDAAAAGAVALDGVMMLVYQGAIALEIWTGRKAPVEVMERAVRASLREWEGRSA